MRVLLVVLLLLFPALASAGDGVQLLPDQTQILVNKDVGGERWAIALNLSGDAPLNVTGNVFRGSSPPAFIWCQISDVQGSAEDIRNAMFSWACSGSDACVAGTGCPWTFISNVTLPGSFFLP